MIPLTDDNFQKEVLCIKSIAYNNGYNPNIIDQIICKKQQKLAQNLLYNSVSENKKWFYLNYIPHTSYKIKRILNKLGINVTISNKHRISNIIVNNKPKLSNSEKSGVYKINCSDCDCFYIGQSGRVIKTRIEKF